MNDTIRTTGIPVPRLHDWRPGNLLNASDLDPPNRLIESMLGAQSVAQEVLYPPVRQPGVRFVVVVGKDESILLTRDAERHPPTLPWDGRWVFGGPEETRMHPWPNSDVRDYAVVSLDADGLIPEDAAILEAVERGGSWFVQAPAAGGGGATKFLVANDRFLSSAQRPAMRNDYFFAVKPGTEVDPDTDFYADEDLVKIAKPHKLQTAPWNNRTVHLNEFSIYVKYTNYVSSPVQRRRATQWDPPPEDRALFPFIQRTEMIWPEYGTDRDSLTGEDIIKAVQVGAAATGIEGVHWEDTNDSGRVWTVLPLGFLS